MPCASAPTRAWAQSHLSRFRFDVRLRNQLAVAQRRLTFRCSRRAAVRWPGPEGPRALQASAGQIGWHVEAARGRTKDPLGECPWAQKGLNVEMCDVVDEFGTRTGRAVIRGTELAPGEFHLVVHIWIRDETGEYLIERRAPDLESDPGSGRRPLAMCRQVRTVSPAPFGRQARSSESSCRRRTSGDLIGSKWEPVLRTSGWQKFRQKSPVGSGHPRLRLNRW